MWNARVLVVVWLGACAGAGAGACSSSHGVGALGGSGGGGDDSAVDGGGGGSSSTGDATSAAGSGSGSPLACSGRAAQPLDATWTVTVGGVQRTALVHVPASYDPTHPAPVVVDLHGLGGDGADEEALTSSDQKADAEGFISVHPNGESASFNAGACCGAASTDNVDDIGFMTALLDQLDAQLCIDDARVFAMGMSNGAYMSHRIGCELADRFAAIGPVSGGIAVTCAPSRPVPVFAIHGNADPIVSYTFGEDAASFWIANNACTTMATTYQNGVATCVTHSGCTAGADVTWCTIDQGGHQWPGGETIPLLGNNTDDLDATSAIWTFFAAHPKP